MSFEPEVQSRRPLPRPTAVVRRPDDADLRKGKRLFMPLLKTRLAGMIWGAVLALVPLCAPPAHAETAAEKTLAGLVDRLEAELPARIGIAIRDSSSDWQWSHRADERFLMASTFKSLACGAALYRADHGELDINEKLLITRKSLLSYAPFAKKHVGEKRSIDELCFAALDLSDNTAANLVVDRLGGPKKITAILREIGDGVTRLDRKEPELNIYAPGDPRDTTTPQAMSATWKAMLLGPALKPASQERLANWMRHGGVTGKLIRAAAPRDWDIADKSGTGEGYTRNLMSMVTPPDHAPYFVAIYLTDSPTDVATRDAAVARLGAAIVDVLKER